MTKIFLKLNYILDYFFLDCPLRLAEPASYLFQDYYEDRKIENRNIFSMLSAQSKVVERKIIVCQIHSGVAIVFAVL